MNSIARIVALSLTGTLVACGGPTDVEATATADQAVKTDHGSGEAIVTVAKGHWTVGPLTVLSMDPTTGHATATGGDTFTGTFTGSSTYFLSGTFAADGSFTGYSDETITATAPDGTSGTITEAHQPLFINAQGDFYEISPITGGTGAWAGSTGLLSYTGVVNIANPTANTPNQGGEYEGVWIRPAPKK